MPGGVVHVSKRYGRHVALSDVSLDVPGGQIVGLVGPNGAGKTTLLRILAGLVRPSSGVRPDIDHVAYFGGEHTLPPDVSARRWMSLFVSLIPGAPPRTRFGVLSRGTRQRLGLEATLGASTAHLLLLDEPWEGLDPDAARWLSDALITLRDLGVAILVSSHRIHDLASVCDWCQFLVGGRIAAPALACAMLPPDERAAALMQAFDRAREMR